MADQTDCGICTKGRLIGSMSFDIRLFQGCRVCECMTTNKRCQDAQLLLSYLISRLWGSDSDAEVILPQLQRQKESILAAYGICAGPSGVTAHGLHACAVHLTTVCRAGLWLRRRWWVDVQLPQGGIVRIQNLKCCTSCSKHSRSLCCGHDGHPQAASLDVVDMVGQKYRMQAASTNSMFEMAAQQQLLT